MRMRNKPYLPRRLEECAGIIINDPRAQKGRWRELFPNAAGVCLEIGCGKGKFINQLANENPSLLYIAIEKEENALILAAEKTKELGLDNLFYIAEYADSLLEYFSPNELDLIYLNFSDPWPKARRAKRRLTHTNFLRMYKQILKPACNIMFKTDNRELFDFSVESFEINGFELEQVCYDLHASPLKYATTEYEDKFAALGAPICFLQAVNPEK